MANDNVLIVGAGPTGLALALWLTRLGTSVRIIDKSSEPGTTSRALAVQARTLEFYDQLGFAKEVDASGVHIEGINLWGGGTQLTHVSLRDLGHGMSPFPFPLIYPQDEHEKLLIGKLEQMGVKVERETTLTGFEESEAGVVATLRLPDGRDVQHRAAYLAGCDGARSTVRETLGIGFPGGTYSGYFYVADVDVAAGPPGNEISVDLEGGNFVAIFPMKGTGHFRLIGTAPEQHERALTFEDVRGQAIAKMRLDVTTVHWFSTYRVHHRVADHFRRGRAFLLGDAAHVHSPVGGQGMNTGIGDAVNLAWKLAAVLQGKATAELLDSYEPERRAFAELLVGTTDRAFTLVTEQGWLAELVRLRIIPLIAPRVTGLAAVRRAMFRTVSQIRVEYHDSPLSQGEAGKVRAGERLPWVELANGGHNFAPLRSLDWQLHVYGKTSPEVVEECARLRLAVCNFEWEPAMQQVGLLKDAGYLVRPDGYVALADPVLDPAILRSYLQGISLRTPL